MKIIKTLSRGERFVGVVVHKDRVIVASTRRIFMLVDDRLVPLKLEKAAEALDGAADT